GSYTATFSATDKDGALTTGTASVTIGRRAAAIAYLGSSAVMRGAARLSARFDDTTDTVTARLGGHAVTFTLGATSCTAKADAAGEASCVVDTSVQRLGP